VIKDREVDFELFVGAALSGYNAINFGLDSIRQKIKEATKGNKPTVRVCEMINDFGEQYNHLRALKFFMIEAFLKMSEDNKTKINAQILLLKYVDKINFDTIQKMLRMPNSTYYRRLETAKVQFANALREVGLTDEIVMKIVEKEKWLVRIYEKLQLRDLDEMKEVG